MIAGRRVLLTGASGGIGGELARELLARGAEVLLTGRSAASLDRQRALLSRVASDRVEARIADLTVRADREQLCEFASRWRGGIDVLVNNAGTNGFALLADESAADVERIIATNVTAPIELCRLLLPHLESRPEAAIVNIGSVFGAIGYPGFTLYSATKFALRGFSEALRRELGGSSISVHYFAPRATRTAFNSDGVEAMNAELKVAMDSPQQVAADVCVLLEAGRQEATRGWPERLFVRLNALVPRLVDRALRSRLPVVRRYAQSAPRARDLRSQRTSFQSQREVIS